MKLADLDRAQRLVERRARALEARARLEAGETLRLTVGAGGGALEIPLAKGFEAKLRADFAAAFAAQAAEDEQALAALGVEP